MGADIVKRPNHRARNALNERTNLPVAALPQEKEYSRMTGL
jgi:hypothetical protein